ncbi:tRNA lysidine(34) synthetase TilS [Kiritimatiella glycovorans]|uniref:tRNA(Ile)-lysidine synthase n=1 Tax=Kiritimatiella glycovorans TaxID=1307763 RepID=A0A0G3EG88_9BACT|nr:tRNA lysidine(34) synthetase TilS [Kiritimatiella glycovorans]AKJ65353.1 tRNA(Ile)-lysidine synthase [Kiritimatiella glycovorans]
MKVFDQVRASLKQSGFAGRGATIALAVSGGADSVFLLHALHFLAAPLDLRLCTLHLHHGIRPRGAEQDLRLVRALSWRLGIPCFSARRDVPALAESENLSIEMAARRARRDFFTDAGRRLEIDAVALGHTADDRVESVLLKLSRGTGLRGLAGMRPVHREDALTLLRPLLDVRREELVAVLHAHRIPWREDTTNRDRKIPRNMVRHRILPEIEQRLHPAFRENVLRSLDILREEEAWLSDMALGLMKSVTAPRRGQLLAERLRAYPVAARRRMLQAWLHECEVEVDALSFETLERIDALCAHDRGTRSVPLRGTLRVVNQYGKLRVARRGERRRAGFRTEIQVEGETWLPGPGLHVAARFGRGIQRDRARRIGEFPARASISRKAVGGHPLTVRSFREGDRMRPLGSGGTRKLQDIFTDARVPREERTQIPLVECRGEIVWIPGFRIAENWKLHDPRQKAVWLSIDRKGPEEDG